MFLNQSFFVSVSVCLFLCFCVVFLLCVLHTSSFFQAAMVRTEVYFVLVISVSLVIFLCFCLCVFVSVLSFFFFVLYILLSGCNGSYRGLILS